MFLKKEFTSWKYQISKLDVKRPVGKHRVIAHYESPSLAQLSPCPYHTPSSSKYLAHHLVLSGGDKFEIFCKPLSENTNCGFCKYFQDFYSQFFFLSNLRATHVSTFTVYKHYKSWEWAVPSSERAQLSLKLEARLVD